MPRTRLTSTFVKNAVEEKLKLEPHAERTIFWDAALSGFGLMVTKAGHTSFVVQYRVRRKSRRYAIERLPSLGEARKRAIALLDKVAKGRDPLEDRKKEQEAAKDTLKSIGEEYLTREAKRLRGIDERRRILEKYVYPKLGSRHIAEIKRSDIVRLLDRIEDENGPVQADHTLAVLRRVLNWHASRSDDFRSPVVRGMTRTKPKERARERKLGDDELRAVWKAAETFKGPFGCLVRFILLTATRRQETACLRREELDGTNWTIPAARYKSKHDHLVPLSPAAVGVLNSMPVIGRRKDTGYVFTTDGKRALGGFSKFKSDFDKACGVTGWTLHDLRRTARSLLSRAGVNADVAERCLGHVIPGVRGTYDRHEYLEEKKLAFEALAALIERIVNPQENVVALRSAV
jgi:integrase